MPTADEFITSPFYKLYQRWRQALPCAVIEDWRARNLFSELVLRYGEEQRRYHVMAHIAYCLAVWDTVKHLVPSRLHQLIELAIFYHDAIYDPDRRDNEERSADLLRMHLRVLGCEVEFVERVAKPIELTMHRGTALPEDDPACWVLDIDLASLADGPAQFDQNTLDIRFEQEQVPGFRLSTWKEKQIAFFKALLAREHIYYTAQFQKTHEMKARANLQRAIHKFQAA